MASLYFVSGFFLVFNVIAGGAQESLEEMENTWWGPEEDIGKTDTIIRPFQVYFKDEVISDLKERLRNHRPVTPPLKGVGFQYGFNTDYLDRWVNYWVYDYDFHEREMYMNQFPQYTTNIQGLNIHFLWVKPKVPQHVEIVPMLYLHGWPNTVRELYESIPYLTSYNKSRTFALEIIAPNLPGFGFSDGAVRPGLGNMEMAVVLKNLMSRLGIQKFYIQGGDWGAQVGTFIATFYPEEVLGYHTNLPISRSPLSLALWFAGQLDTSQFDPAIVDRLYPVSKVLMFLIKESGYYHLNANKPDSIGVAMSDSPAGMLAYLLQLISSGTRAGNPLTQDGGLEQYYSRDSLLDVMTLIWVSNSFTTSCRIYAESTNMRNYNSSWSTVPTPVPTWTMHAKDEIFYQTPSMLKYKYTNLLHSTILDEGGHFIQFEMPKVFSEDVLQAISAFRVWHAMKRKYRYEL